MSISDERWEEFTRHTEAIIAEHGHMIQGVFPTKDSDDPYCFEYIVGLRTSVIVHGIDPQAGHALLNMVAAEVLTLDPTPDDGSEIKGDSGKTTLWLFTVTPTDNFGVQISRARRRKELFLAMQLIIADEEFRPPWDPDYDPVYLAAQGLALDHDGALHLLHYDRIINREDLPNGNGSTEEGA